MNSKTKHTIAILIVIAAIALSCFGMYVATNTSSITSDNAPAASAPQFPSESGIDQFVITNLNVGKADCAVLTYKNTVGIIDTGTYESYSTLSEFLTNNDIQKIDYLILTHYDQDHIGGAIRLLRDYNCDSIYLPDYVSEKKYYSELMSIIRNFNNVYFVNNEQTLSVESLTLNIIPADEPVSLLESESNRDNNMSLVTIVSFGNNTFLFTGDIEKDRIAQMLSCHDNLDADWIKMPHHGEYQKKTAKLIEAVTPEYAVISTSNERPTDEKLTNLLEEDHIKIFDTVHSNVITICDGSNITVINQ